MIRTASIVLVVIAVTLLVCAAASMAAESDARPAPLMGVPIMTGLSRVRLPETPAAPTSLDVVRNNLNAIAPFAYQALQAIEVRRGARYRDSEIPAVARTPEFQAEVNRAQQRFCENPQNASSLACHGWPLTAKNAAPTRMQDSDVLATARKTLSGNEEVIAPNN
ncbi:hypothetical protein WI25_33370 [Burkholderia cepacia]|uniref:hypothetical protein n=1 Tax=Burkholderia cepacia TaxID=292 RepID=UPI000757B80E|nr:hypothetical protein [Burkholderia cepacia]KUY87070.1 hypothetical protein WI25_33370 [Burkholderia cepacia]